MVVLQLDTGLFPDRETVAETLAVLQAHGAVLRRIDLAALRAEEEWDAVVTAIRAADRVVTV